MPRGRVALLLSCLSTCHSRCTRVSREEQLSLMREGLNATSGNHTAPPDPIFGIWFLNWRVYGENQTVIPAQLFADGLLGLYEPTGWDLAASSYTHPLFAGGFPFWTSTVTLDGTLDLVLWRLGLWWNQQRLVFGSQDQITAIERIGTSDVLLCKLSAWFPRLTQSVLAVLGGESYDPDSCTWVSGWTTDPIDATAGTFDRYYDGKLEYTAYKLYGRGGVAYLQNIAIWEQYSIPYVWHCPA